MKNASQTPNKGKTKSEVFIKVVRCLAVSGFFSSSKDFTLYYRSFKFVLFNL
jgi:hypothetical protein